MEFNGEQHYLALIFNYFKAGVIRDDCVQRLQAAFGNKCPCRATVFRWFKEFCRGRNFLHNDEHIGRPLSAVTPDNVSAIRKNKFMYSRSEKKKIEIPIFISIQIII